MDIAHPRDLVMGGLALKLIHSICVTMFRREDFGTLADLCLLCCSIYIGQAEGRPMSMTKLASYTGMPRATVIRKVRTMVDMGIVELVNGKLAALRLDGIDRKQAERESEQRMKMVVREAAKLSKMDTR